MRLRDIKLTEAELLEINMSPGNLKRLTAGIDARAGMEFEMCVPGAAQADEDYEPEPDYDSDESARSIDDICEFFHDGDHNGRREIERLRERLQSDYEDWASERLYEEWNDQAIDLVYEYVKNNVDDETIISALELDSDAEGNPPVVGRKEWARYAEHCLEDQNDTYNEAYEEFRDDWYNSGDQEETWLEHEGLERMSDIENSYHITWPHWHYDNPGQGGVNVETVAGEFERAIGRPVNWSNNYHGGKRTPDGYVVEPDGSIDTEDEADGGLEFVSPPLPLDEMFKDLEKVKAWANRMGCYTNSSTGLHINVSVPGFDNQRLDYVKLALLLGDEHVLEVFERMGNTYCKSAMEVVKKRVQNNPDAAENLLNQMRGHLDQMATKAVHTGTTDKYTSINTKSGYVEFRSPGGDWLNKLSEGEEIQHTLLRFVVALDAACKPELYREEYLKKLYKVLDVTSNQDPLWYFVRYSTGGFSPTVLKSFIRQTQLERDVKRGKDKVPPGNQQSAEPIPGSTLDLQRQRAAGAEQDYLVDFELDDGQTGIERVRATSPEAAETQVAASLEKEGYEIVRINAEPVPNQSAPRQQQQPAQSPAPQQPGMGQWNGQWKVLVGGQEVYRFGGIGNSQADANRIAAAWLRQNGQGVSGEGFEVYPVMD